MAIFFNFYTTSNHLHSLQIENCDSNSRLVVDEDDNGRLRFERVKSRLTQNTSARQSPNCDNEILSISDAFDGEGNCKNGTDIHYCLRPPQLSVRWPRLSVRCDHGGGLTVTIFVHLTLPTGNLHPILSTKSPTTNSPS